MKPGMQHLLALLRGTPHPPMDEQQWRTTLQLASAEAVLPWLALRVLASDPPPPPVIVEALHRTQRDFHLRTSFFASQLAGILQSFASADLPVLLLKGPSFAERVYGAALLRTSRDLDLLVRPADFAHARQLLFSLGFQPYSPPDDYHQSLRRDTLMVELHHDVENPLAFDFHVQSAWQSARPASFHGQPALLLAPTDELLYLALHAVRHRYGRLSYVLDFALALQHHAAPGASRPQAAPLASLLALASLMAGHLLPQATNQVLPPREVEAGAAALPLQSSPQTDSHTRRLAGRLWQALLDQPEPILDWQSLHQFYVELEPTALRRLTRQLRHTRILATRLTQPDLDFAAAHGLHRDWQAHLLRPIRLLLNGRGAP